MSELFFCQLPPVYDPQSLTPLLSYLEPARRDRLNQITDTDTRREMLFGSLLTRYVLLSFARALTPADEAMPENTDLTFRRSEKGKPIAEFSEGSAAPSFNLSHSHDGILLGVSATGAIGVDIEPEDRRFRLSPAACASLFSPEEYGQLPPEGDPDRNRMLIALWTRKEALSKCTGEGMGAPRNVAALDTLLPDREGRLITGTRDGYLWSVCTEEPEPVSLNIVPVEELFAFFAGDEKAFLPPGPGNEPEPKNE